MGVVVVSIWAHDAVGIWLWDTALTPGDVLKSPVYGWVVLVEGPEQGATDEVWRVRFLGPPAWSGHQAGDESWLGYCSKLTDPFEDLPPALRSALLEQVERKNIAFAEEQARFYRAQDELTQADIRAFFESDGAEKVRQVKLKIRDRIPTSFDLKRQSEMEGL